MSHLTLLESYLARNDELMSDGHTNHYRRKQRIGRWEYNLSPIAVAEAYSQLALDDEESARVLLANGKYRTSVYFTVQAMEKLVRHRIFALANPSIEYNRERTTTHNLDELLDFLIEIVSHDTQVRKQVRDQLDHHVLGGVRFGLLHNDARYVSYSHKNDSFNALQIVRFDAELVLEKLEHLKLFLDEIDKLRG